MRSIGKTCWKSFRKPVFSHGFHGFPYRSTIFVAEITPNYVEEMKMEDVRAEAAVAVASARCCCGCALQRGRSPVNSWELWRSPQMVHDGKIMVK